MAQKDSAAPPGLADVVKQVRAHLSALPEGNATAKFRVATRLVDGLTTAARMRRFELTIDEPPELGGNDRGPNPVEVVLAAFGTCQEIVYAVYAAALGIRLEGIEMDVEGELDPRGFFGVADVVPGFSKVRFQVRIQSNDSPARIEKLVEEVNRHCPVLDILQRGLPVEGTVELNGRRLEEQLEPVPEPVT